MNFTHRGRIRKISKICRFWDFSSSSICKLLFTFVTFLDIIIKNESLGILLFLADNEGFVVKPISSNVANIITRMTKADAMAPIVALETTVVIGRTCEAYKRGKWDEARERFCEETMGSITWLCGVKYLNKLGDKILDNILKAKGQSFDVGTDKVLRRPFDNFMKNSAPKGFSAKQVALLKAGKVLTSIVLANLFIGFVVPKANQAITKKLRHERKEHLQHNQTTPSFKGGGAFAAINTFTNAIENTNTGQLLSSDAGIAGGRIYNARSNEERREIAIRDIGSIYFYMWAQGHVRQGLNKLETGHSTRLNPTTAGLFTEHLNEFLDKNNKELSVEEFRRLTLGKNNPESALPKGMRFETGEVSSFNRFFGAKPLEVIKLSEAEKFFNDKNTIARLREMSKLQPRRVGESVLTKQQVIDALNVAEINDPKLLYKVFDEHTGGDFAKEYKYVSNSKLYKLKGEMAQYIETICKASKNGKVDKELLEKVKNQNIKYSGINFLAGFAVASLFLGTLIPKFQYYITRKTTGVDAFPGVYDFKHHKEVDA